MPILFDQSVVNTNENCDAMLGFKTSFNSVSCGMIMQWL